MLPARISKAFDSVIGRTFELSLTKNYVSRWTAVHGIRELIQNALDSDSPFVYELGFDEQGHFLRLSSEFSSLTPQTLLLGATSKRESDSAIGSFGEGYKIALLVLTREGYDVELLNGDFVWRPRFKMSRTFGEEVLVIDEHVSSDRGNKGLSFVVRGIDDDLRDKVIASCLLMQDNVGQVKKTKFGDILLDRPGLLYVGNLFVCETDLKFGYNILPKFIRLERDRQTVDSWDLKDTTIKMWYDVGDMERVAEMLSDQVPDVEYARYNAPEIIKEECYKVFRKNNPGALIASSPTEMREMVERGMTNTVYVGGAFYDVVSSSKSYKDDSKGLYIAARTPNDVLKEWLSANRSEMRTKALVSFKEILDASNKWRLK